METNNFRLSLGELVNQLVAAQVKYGPDVLVWVETPGSTRAINGVRTEVYKISGASVVIEAHSWTNQ